LRAARNLLCTVLKHNGSASSPTAEYALCTVCVRFCLTGLDGAAHFIQQQPGASEHSPNYDDDATPDSIPDVRSICGLEHMSLNAALVMHLTCESFLMLACARNARTIHERCTPDSKAESVDVR
jgi:hypothetical protein